MGKAVKNKQRPVNLDLQTISFPVTAIASILHRVSGVITFVALAILLWMLGTSLSSPEGFETVVAIMDNFLVKFVLWGILPALAYHIVGGLRHLVMDMGHWEELDSANQSARVGFLITGILAVLAGVLVW